jgi:CrcB protein
MAQDTREIGYPQAFRADQFAAIAAGGVVGALARHAGELLLPTVGLAFPWITFIENIVGSFLLAFTGSVMAQRLKHPLLNCFLVVGVYGSYTTFSTFSAGFWQLFDAGLDALAWGYAVSTVVCGLIAVFVGHALGSLKEWAPRGS